MNKKSENLKKLLIAFVVLGLFFTSSYYYVFGKKLAKHPKKPVLTAQVNLNHKAKPVSTIPAEKKGNIPATVTTPAEKIIQNKIEEKKQQAEKQPAVAKESEKPAITQKRKPTDINNLLANASRTSGKNDPFSYSESKFMPNKSIGASNNQSNTNQMLPDLNMLPVPPELSTETIKEPSDSVAIKGFIGNKVIAEIKGYTESLGVNESLKGVKVLNVDSLNLTCDFQIEGKKVTKTMQPVTPKQNKNIDINYIHY